MKCTKNQQDLPGALPCGIIDTMFKQVKYGAELPQEYSGTNFEPKGNNVKTEVKLKIKRINHGTSIEYCVQWIEKVLNQYGEDVFKLNENYSSYHDDLQDAKDTKKAVMESYSKTNYTNIIFVN